MITFPRYDSYKDSKVEWLGKIPSHWKIKKLKFLAKIKNGQDHSSLLVDKPGYPVVGSGGRFAYASQYLFRGESVLLGRKGTIDKPLYINEDFWTVDTMFYTEIFTGTIPKFLYYCALTIPFSLYSTNTAIPSMTQKDLNNHTFAYPPMEEQKCIVDFLDRKTSEIDEAIAKKQRLIELLQEQKAILINQAVTKGLNPDVEMRDSGIDWIGDIPVHWHTQKIKRLFLELDHRSTTGSEILLSLRMYSGLIPHDDVSDKPIRNDELVGYKKVNAGELVMNRMRASIGLFGVARESGLVSPDYAIFVQQEDLRTDYYLNLFKTEAMKQLFLIHSKGLGTGSAGFLRLYSDKFGAIEVPYPSADEQDEILDYIHLISREIASAVSS